MELRSYRVSASTHKRLKILAAEMGATIGTVLAYLLDVTDPMEPDEIVELLKDKGR